MTDKVLYQIIADEIKSKNIDTALWAQAKEAAQGDLDRTEANYIRLRIIELIKASSQQQNSTSLTLVSNGVVKVDEVLRVRTELTKKLLGEKKYSLYSILRVRPDASDAMISAAIQELQAGNLDGPKVSPAEFKYVKDTLGQSDTRQQYDRQLLASLSSNSMQIFQDDEGAGIGDDNSWWNSGKMTVVITTLSIAIFGYLGIQYLKVKNTGEVQKISVESQMEVMQTISDSEKARVQADIDRKNEEARRIAEKQIQEMEMRNRTADRLRDEQLQQAEERKLQYEQQKNIQAEQEAARKEEMRIANEKRYYTCMNVQLSRGITTYNANAACGSYR
ncbi:MAG: hypothetical protein PHP57_11540 [Sideroxydans sp.]|nr:hypothetical protein [Sideroxydans sp.]